MVCSLNAQLIEKRDHFSFFRNQATKAEFEDAI
ncbi:Uncharacterised protein [Shewanella putrefaciens]|nr:hypothetical protein [Shewanella putrefaciens]SUI67180.1 Uncharacterised protein [Shewanella putrefaciens]